MAKTKYGQYIKKLSFNDYGKGAYRQGTTMTGEFLGLDVHIEYGSYWTAGKMGKEPYGAHVHDFDQVLVWMGADANNLSELGAEVELCLGGELEKHMITTSKAVAIPKGLPHLPATITRLDKRFIFFVVSLAPEYKATPVLSDKKPSELAGWRDAKYRNRIIPLYFTRKGAWWYGPQNRDDSGGLITNNIRGKEQLGFNFVMLYESITKAPYRWNPIPDKPHAHFHTQVMLFLGTDTNDLSELGGEVEIYMGEEEERHVFSTPTAVVIPENLPHWPGGTLKLTKPVIMADIHPAGT